MSFQKRKLGHINQYNSFWDFLKRFVNFKIFSKLVLLFGAIWIIWYTSNYVFQWWQEIFKSFSVFSLNFISDSFWKELKKDELGQFNVLLVGYWWDKHKWTFLTDTMMIASYDPQVDSVTFLSVPRDLYIHYNSKRSGRLNWLFPYYYYSNNGDFNVAANKLMGKMKKITGINVDYYALVDFDWFKNLIDSFDWININVPQTIVDKEYPTEDWGYTTFKISQWVHKMDWETALKYARSRHSTSDFSRSRRQQQIIKAVIQEFFSFENITSIDKLKSIYWEYKNMLKTNISFKQILWMVKYVDNIEHFFSFVYNTNCIGRDFKNTEAGCFLYFPSRDAFGGAAIILPKWASAGNIDYYKKLQDFAFMVIHNQKYLIENAEISIKNGVSRPLLRQEYWYLFPVATDLATELKKYDFNIKSVWNTEKNYKKTVVYKNWTWNYESTINVLRMFFEIDSVVEWSSEYENDITVVLWDQYLK